MMILLLWYWYSYYKVKLQYFGHLMWRANLLEKTLMLGNIEGRRRRGWQRMRQLDGITNFIDTSLFEQASGVGDGQGGLVCCDSWGRKEYNTTEWLNNNNNKLRYHHIESFYGWFSFDVILIIWRHIFHTYWDI